MFLLSTPTATTRRSRFSCSRSTTCRTRVCRSRVLVVHPEDDDAAISFLVFEIYDVPQMRGAPQTGRAHQSGILAAPFLVASARHCVCRIQRRSASSDRALTGEFSGSFPVARRVTACLVFRGVRCRLIGPSRSKFSGLFPVASARHACVGFRVVRRRRIGLSRGKFSGLFPVASARHCVCRLPRTSNRRCRTVSIPIAKMLRTKVADRCRERSTYPP